MEELPYIDEHVMPTAGTAEEVWDALVTVLVRTFGGVRIVTRALGCDSVAVNGRFTGEAGDELPGFRVAAADRGRWLVLDGRHRWSRYRLEFLLDGRRLRARTYAEFPRLAGRAYRAAVIGTGGHRVVTRRLLRRVARRADCA